MIEEVFEPEIEPIEAAAVFGNRIDLARSYAAALVRNSDLLGLLGPREMPRLWSRHILNSAVVAELVPPGKTVCDIGSGAGLPGIPMAIVLPDTLFTLIEPMERRSDWLISVIDELGLQNVEVIRARAEDVGEVFDIATARAVSALPKLLRMCIPLVRHGGEILALKGSKAAEEIEEAKRIQKKLGVESFKIEFAGARLLSEPTLVVRTKLV